MSRVWKSEQLLVALPWRPTLVHPPDDSEAEPNADPKAESGVSTQAMLAETNRRATALLEEARQAAEEILAEAKKEAERRKQAGYDAGRKAGYAAGEAAGKASCQKAEQEWQRAKLGLVEKDRAMLLGAEPELVQLAVMTASRVIGQKLRTDDQVVQSSLKQLLGAALGAREALVQVSPRDFELLWAKRQDWAASIPGVKQFDMQVDPLLSKGDLVLVTNQGTVDARVETMLQQVADQLAAGGEQT